MLSIKPFLLLISWVCFSMSLFGQKATIHGVIHVDGQNQEFASITISTDPIRGAQSNSKGKYHLHDIPFGTYEVTASYIGYKQEKISITLDEANPSLDLSFNLTEPINTLDKIVITGTKTFKRQTDSPVIVNVLDSKTLDQVQACTLSEGLKFQPGLRVETDCQTCNYTQLRINGLAGGYSQVLINGRPIFSPLTGLYGLEQLPSNMIERVEVIRGGGSSLYGSSAIGGTVNVILKTPRKNGYEFNSYMQRINGQSNDLVINGNSTVLSKSKNTGVSFFFNQRNRETYDHNEDNFSEIPLINNTSAGANFFHLPNENQKLEISLSKIYEFRYGGEMVDLPAFQTDQSEERTHHIWMSSIDYQINFNGEQSSLITYAAWQNTNREHYTGIFPDEEIEIENHLNNPPFGDSQARTFHGGFQLNHKLNNFLKGVNTLTLGSEYVLDDIFDEIPAYNFLVDQTTKDLGSFIQSDWEITPSLTLLSGLRMDIHNLLDQPVFTARGSLLYKYKNNTQLRISYGTGFRAPQAFDSDLHIAFAGGGVSRVTLSPDLTQENSESISASINYDYPMEKFIAGFTLEGFYTRLNDAFILQPIGEDEFGEQFLKKNGQGATVQGIILEVRANFNKKAQVEGGFTLQSSLFDNKVQYIDELEGIKEFVRTPNDYGFLNLTLTPDKPWNANLNCVYTGRMKVPHFAGAPNQEMDEIITSQTFTEINLRFGYEFDFKKPSSILEIYGGVKNLINAYQNDFDIEKNRDSNFVYGPGLPRTIFAGIRWSSN